MKNTFENVVEEIIDELYEKAYDLLMETGLIFEETEEGVVYKDPVQNKTFRITIRQEEMF